MSRRMFKGVRASGVKLRLKCSDKGQKKERGYRLGIMLRPKEFTPLDSLYLFENPARPRPNRTLGGTNCNADMAPVRSVISVSIFSGFASPLSTVVGGCDGRDVRDLSSECDASFSKVFAWRLNSFACD